MKAPNTVAVDDTERPRKAGRNRKPTACSVIRRQSGCGICGSQNLAAQGVAYCQECGAEAEFLETTESWGYGLLSWGQERKMTVSGCTCKREEMEGYSYRWRIKLWGVKKCLDCGAVKGRFCPNCRQSRCWRSPVGGKKYCQNCGYRTV